MQVQAIGPDCDTMALENLNRLEYTNQAADIGIKSD
jgi:glucose-6-phosphate 1-dehydrogenase